MARRTESRTSCSMIVRVSGVAWLHAVETDFGTDQVRSQPARRSRLVAAGLLQDLRDHSAFDDAEIGGVAAK